LDAARSQQRALGAPAPWWDLSRWLDITSTQGTSDPTKPALLKLDSPQPSRPAAGRIRKFISWREPLRESLYSLRSSSSSEETATPETSQVDLAVPDSEDQPALALLADLQSACASEPALGLAAAQGKFTARRFTAKDSRVPACARYHLAHSMRWVGTDSLGRPVAYLCFSQSPSRSDPDANLAHCVSTLEQMEARLDALRTPLAKWVVVLDFHGFGLRDATPLAARRLFSVLQAHFPERLALAILYDAPGYLGVYWKALAQSVAPVTRRKLHQVPHNPEGPAGGKGARAWDAAGEELAAWLCAEVAQNRAPHSSKGPKRYWQAPRGLSASSRHDPRGTATWLGDATRCRSPAEVEASEGSGAPATRGVQT